MHAHGVAVDDPGGDMREQLLLVDDDPTLRRVLAAALEKRDYAVVTAPDAEQGQQLAQAHTPDCAVVDLNLPGASGLVLVAALVALDAAMRIVVLTGYASVSTTVEAIKLGATHYLAKPANADEVVAALHHDDGDSAVSPPSQPLSLKRLEWEYIQRHLTDNNGNVSATARQLGMHLRTLQRKLEKHPVRR